jgi:hypothetical protein
MSERRLAYSSALSLPPLTETIQPHWRLSSSFTLFVNHAAVV